MNLKRCFNYGKMLWIKHVIPNLFRNPEEKLMQLLKQSELKDEFEFSMTLLLTKSCYSGQSASFRTKRVVPI